MKPSNDLFRLRNCSAFIGGMLLVSSCAPPAPEAKPREADTAELRLLSQSPGHTVLSRQRMIRFGETVQQDTFAFNGTIIPDERRTVVVPARVSGRIEKLYVRFPYQFVKKGEKLLDLYSPEWSTAVSEYLFLQAKNGSAMLVKQSRKKLLLLGLSERQIVESEKKGEAPQVFSIYSPADGYIIIPETNAQVPGAIPAGTGDGMTGMGISPGNTKATTMNPTGLVREGSYVTPGQTLFSINDAKEVIALLSISSGSATLAKPGTPVQITSELQPGKVMRSTIQLVEPEFETSQRFLSVRAVLPNEDHALKFNSLVSAKLSAGVPGKRAVPSSCVFDLGERKIVWVKTGMIGQENVLVPRVVLAGNAEAGYTEIISGLAPGEEIAQDAGLLVDREGIIHTELR